MTTTTSMHGPAICSRANRARASRPRTMRRLGLLLVVTMLVLITVRAEAQCTSGTDCPTGQFCCPATVRGYTFKACGDTACP